jgi:hypothetical protein
VASVVAPAKAGAEVAMAFRCSSAIAALALGLALIWPQHASARTLAEIRARGTIAMCANPDALPHASKREDLPRPDRDRPRAGAIARAAARGRLDHSSDACELGRLRHSVRHHRRAGVDRGPIKLSHPCQKSDVALALRPGDENVHGFQDLAPGRQRVGVMANSLASSLLGKRGVRTVPYSFESDMVEDLARGDLDACAVSPAIIA